MLLSLLIPTFNEEEIILNALREIERALGESFSKETEIFIVDDGTDSLPDTVEKARAEFGFSRVVVMRNSPALGKGLSLARGFEKASAPIVGFLDVDLSTPPHYIKQAFEAIDSGEADIFIGSRHVPDAKVARDQFFLKDILGHLLGVLARGIIFNGMRNYADTQCGFKFFKSDVARILYRDLVAFDGLTDLEVLIKANLIGYRVVEKGVEWTDLRESKRTLRRILFGEVKSVLRILFEYRFFPTARRKDLSNLRSKHSV